MGKKAVSTEIKQRIIGLSMTGLKYVEIARTIGSVSPSCVSRTIKKFELTGSVLDKTRSGAPRKTTPTDDNSIYRIARRNPDYSCREIAAEINLALNNHISRQTVSRRLIDVELNSYAACRKPMLKPSDRTKRLKFCKQLLAMTDEQIKKIIFSDESNYTVYNRKNKLCVRRKANEKFKNQMLSPRLQNGGGSVGIWGCISYDGVGIPYIYDGRMNQYNYIDTLENYLIPTKDIYFGNDTEWIFQQDNAPCHKARRVNDWFTENGIRVLQWPARSPDLNPIENVWTVIDRKLLKNPVTSLAQLREFLRSTFNELSIDYIHNLN
jgi:transposase